MTTEPASPAAPAPERPGLVATYRRLWPYLWPHGRADLQRRVYLAFGLLLVAKLATMVMPFTFKWATDALVAAVGGHADGVPAGLIAAPMLLIGAYGLARIVMVGLTQVRDGLFAKVAMHAVRRLALQTFEHMHRLSLRFHLERKTGGLTRVLERGRGGIEELSRLMVLTLVPTIVEFALVLGVLAYEFDWHYSAVVLVMVVAYLSFTYKATEWRIGIRRRMNASDTDANTKAVDSLLNFETVKYFGAEGRETARYDESMARYEKASTQTYVSLAVLNAGQAVIFTLGMTAVMWLAARDIMAGRTTIGGFVLANTMLVQLSMPLNFMGMIYREIKQALIDIDDMFRILHRNPEIADRPDASPLAVGNAEVRFEDVHFAYNPDRPILRGVSFTVGPGKTVAIVGPSGPGSRRSRACCSASTSRRTAASRSTGRTSRRSGRIRSAPPSAWSRRTRCCSTTRSATTSATAAGRPPTPRCARPRASPRSTASSRGCRRATTRRSASAASSSRAARSSGSPSPARSSRARRSSSSTRRPRRSIPSPSARSSTRSTRSPGAVPRWSSPTGSRPWSTPTRSSCSTAA